MDMDLNCDIIDHNVDTKNINDPIENSNINLTSRQQPDLQELESMLRD